MRGWLLVAAASLRGKGSRDEVFVNCQEASPPQDDLGKVCAKFNGRSRGYLAYLVLTKELQINSQPVDVRWPT